MSDEQEYMKDEPSEEEPNHHDELEGFGIYDYEQDDLEYYNECEQDDYRHEGDDDE